MRQLVEEPVRSKVHTKHKALKILNDSLRLRIRANHPIQTFILDSQSTQGRNSSRNHRRHQEEQIRDHDESDNRAVDERKGHSSN